MMDHHHNVIPEEVFEPCPLCQTLEGGAVEEVVGVVHGPDVVQKIRNTKPAETVGQPVPATKDKKKNWKYTQTSYQDVW